MVVEAPIIASFPSNDVHGICTLGRPQIGVLYMATVCATPAPKRSSLKSNIEETVIGVSSPTFSKLARINTIWPTLPSHEPSLRLPLTPPGDSGGDVVLEVTPPCSPRLSRSNFVNESKQATPSHNPADTDTARNSKAIQTPTFSLS